MRTLLPTRFQDPDSADGPNPSGSLWTPAALGGLLDHLGRGTALLRTISTLPLIDAWHGAIDALRRPESPARQVLLEQLERSSGLSGPGLSAALEVVLRGVSGPSARELFEAWKPPSPSARESAGEPAAALVVLASNLPGLAAQPLLRALAAREPALLKSASAEPFFAPALLRELVSREPRLADAYAAVTWRGGTPELEAEAARRAGRVVVFGDAAAVAAYGRLAGERVETHGPRASLAILAADADPGVAAIGLARDVALFDQRGCLSVQAVYVAGPAEPLVSLLAAALRERAETWPPGAIDPATAAAVQQLRAEAELRGLRSERLPLAAGTIVVEPRLAFEPSPGLRTVRIHQLADLHRLPALLADWAGRLQGVALGGNPPQSLRGELAALGVTRIARVGEIHDTDASWDGLAPAAA